MRNYVDDEQREAVVWAISETAQATSQWLTDDGAESWGDDWRTHLEQDRARLETLRQLADDWGAKSAVNDCADCLAEIEQALERKPATSETRAAGAAAREA